MRRLLLAAAILSMSAVAQTATQASPNQPMVFRIPAIALSQQVASLGPVNSDSIEVLVRTSNQYTAAIRVTLTYNAGDHDVTVMSERQISNGLDIHTFSVPSYSVVIVSINVKELAILADQTFTGF